MAAFRRRAGSPVPTGDHVAGMLIFVPFTYCHSSIRRSDNPRHAQRRHHPSSSNQPAAALAIVPAAEQFPSRTGTYPWPFGVGEARPENNGGGAPASPGAFVGTPGGRRRFR
jgi:hypothetical protein